MQPWKPNPFPVSHELRQLASVIIVAGGRPVVVGGAVRDHLLGDYHKRAPQPSKDIDVEVFKLPLADLETALSARFKVNAVGRSFGVLKVNVGDETFDVSLPRTESKNGTGHRGFVVESDPNMSFKDAAARRDFTINAIGWSLKGCEFLDPHEGMFDLRMGFLRHVSDAFDEDPLRVLRGCQFAARFGFELAEETLAKCRKLRPELETLAVERLWEEWKKLLLRSSRPSIGLQALVDTGAISLFPELEALQGVQQDPEWHPEGDVWVHNGMVTDSAVRVLDDDGVEDEEERLIVMLGALCHDLGKAPATEFKDGRWRAHGHEEAGVEPTRTFLARIGAPPGIIEAVVPLVAHHLKPFHLARDRASAAAVRRLAMKAPLVRLCRVARADYLGRTTQDALECTDSREIESIRWLLDRAKDLKIEQKGPEAILLGRHLLAMGLKPGPAIGDILREAFEAQLDGVYEDVDGALAWAKERLA